MSDDWYEKQSADDATLGPAEAERKWHGRTRVALEKRRLNASFDEIVRQHYAKKESDRHANPG